MAPDQPFLLQTVKRRTYRLPAASEHLRQNPFRLDTLLRAQPLLLELLPEARDGLINGDSRPLHGRPAPWSLQANLQTNNGRS
jgi:hypothetical protein